MCRNGTIREHVFLASLTAEFKGRSVIIVVYFLFSKTELTQHDTCHRVNEGLIVALMKVVFFN